MSEFEIQEDMYIHELIEGHNELAIKEFQAQRLCAYYVSNPDIAKDVWETLEDARGIIDVSPAGALALASAASEVGIKQLLLRPLVSGLTHTESTSEILANFVISRAGFGQMRALLFELLSTFGGLDLKTYRRSGAASTLWSEVNSNSKVCNQVLHRCTRVSVSQASEAVAIASEIIEHCFPKVLDSMGLHVHDGFKVCAEPHLPGAFNKALDDFSVARKCKLPYLT